MWCHGAATPQNKSEYNAKILLMLGLLCRAGILKQNAPMHQVQYQNDKT